MNRGCLVGIAPGIPDLLRHGWRQRRCCSTGIHYQSSACRSAGRSNDFRPGGTRTLPRRHRLTKSRVALQSSRRVTGFPCPGTYGCSGPVGLVVAKICHASTAELLPAFTHVRRRKLERDLTHLFEPKEPTCRRQAGEREQLLVGDPVGVATVTHVQILSAARGERHRQGLGRVRCDA